MGGIIVKCKYCRGNVVQVMEYDGPELKCIQCSRTAGPVPQTLPLVPGIRVHEVHRQRGWNRAGKTQPGDPALYRQGEDPLVIPRSEGL